MEGHHAFPDSPKYRVGMFKDIWGYKHVVHRKEDKNIAEVPACYHETKHVRKVSGYSGSEEKDS